MPMVDEEAAAPFGVERVDRLFTGSGPGRLEDPEHPVREGVAGERGGAEVLGHGRGHAVVVADLEAVRAPRHRQVAVRGDLLDPPGRDPRPRAAGIDEHLDRVHAARL